MKMLIFIVVLLVPYIAFSQNENEMTYIDIYDLEGRKIPKALLNRVSIHLDNVPFSLALNTISDQGNLELNYTYRDLPVKENVTINLNNVYVVEALFNILADAGLGLSITPQGHLAIIAVDQAGLSSQETQILNGQIYGMVMDKATGEPLPGANVFILGTNIGAASDIDGFYKILSVPAGNCTIRVTYIGYKSEDLTIKVMPDEKTTINIELEYLALEGEEIVITAQAEGQFKAINQQLSANNIKNIVAADRIQEFPDVNAAESIGRLPGISITRDGGEANKVVIRGLAPKYNTVMVNGIEVPSTDREDRSVDLSMVSSNMLSSIEVIKSLTPDMEANAIGGAVNLKLKEAPDDFTYEIRSQGGYNGLNEELNNYLIAGIASSRFFDNKLGVNVNFNREKVDRSSEQLQANYSVVTTQSKMRLNDVRLRRRDEDRARTGFGLVLDYNSNNSKYFYTSFFSRTQRDYIDIDDQYNAESNTHNYDVAHNRDFQTDMFSNAFQGENLFKPFGLDYSISYIKTNRKEPNSRTWRFQEENAFENQMDQYSGVQGILPYAKNDLSRTYWMDSDLHKRFAQETDFTAALNLTLPYRFNNNISGKFKFGGKYRHKTRTNDEQHLDGSLGYNGDSKRRNLIVDDYLPGIAVRDTDHPWGLITIENIKDEDYKSEILDGKYNIYWAPRLDYLNTVFDGFLDDDIDDDNRLNDPLWIGNVDEYAWDYDFIDNYSAFYLMTELNLGTRLMVLPGFRYEQSRSRYIANETIAPQVFELPNSSETKSKRGNEYWFPLAHIRYKATDWFDVRLSATRSISRPDYRAISPYSFINSTKTSVQYGNPDLKPSTAKNLDAYFSFYSNYIGLFTLGGFYKEIEDLIYSYSWTTVKGDPMIPLAGDAAGVVVSTWMNNKHQAYLKGIEIDWQTNFWYLPSPFNNFVLNINYSKIISDTKYPYNYVDSVPIPTFPFKKVVRVESNRPGRLIQQPNDIVNVSLGYDIKGFSTNFSLLYQGNTTRSVGNLEEQDTFTKDFIKIDLKLRQKLPLKGLEIYCNLSNLTDRYDETYQNEPRYFRDIDQYGFTIDIGLRFKNIK
jgi:TonB-dependent receptor